jgi:hypothetical protein
VFPINKTEYPDITKTHVKVALNTN